MKEPNYTNQDRDREEDQTSRLSDQVSTAENSPSPKDSASYPSDRISSSDDPESGSDEDFFSDPNSAADPAEQPYDGPIVTVKGLRKSFKDHEVLKGVDLVVNKGENLVVLGKSGSGKSVLIKCLVKLEWPDEGEIEVFGKNISDLDYREFNEMRLKIGFLFQNGALYDSMTVRENLAFPLKQHRKKMPRDKKEALIMEMLNDVGLSEVVDRCLPNYQADRTSASAWQGP